MLFEYILDLQGVFFIINFLMILIVLAYQQVLQYHQIQYLIQEPKAKKQDF